MAAIKSNSDLEKHLYQLLIQNQEDLLPNYKNIVSSDITKESPDIRLYYDDGYILGIEITRSMDENLQKAYAIRDDMDKSLSFVPTIFENNKMSGDDIKRHLNKSKETLYGMPYKGNELEEKVFSNIQLSLEKKVKKFDTYEKFSKNWLYIYHSDRVSLDHQLVLELFQEYIKTIDFKFDCIILLLGKNFYRYQNKILHTI